MKEQIVIVGAGQGGLQAAASLRQGGYDGRLTLIGAEPGLPYQRPPLSKAFLKEGNADKLTLRPQTFFDTHRIDYRPETKVQAIDRSAARVGLDGEQLAYDHLILATGTRAAPLPIPGSERCLVLRDLSDAARLRTAMETAQSIIVIGGGFIGLEFAAVAAGLGKDVTVVEAENRLMARAISTRLSARFAEKHTSLGVAVHFECRAAEIRETGVVLENGEYLPADIVLSATGVVPNVELASQAGLKTENGIQVDAQLRTDDPAISALGDVACFPDQRNNQVPTRIESVQAATDHARHIAHRLTAGSGDPYTALPWFWSDQGDWKLQIAGLPRGGLDEVPYGEGANFLFEEDRLVAVETINDPRTHMMARRWLAEPDAVVCRETVLDFSRTSQNT